MQLSVFAAGTVTLAWNANSDPTVTGYNIYYGGASGVYTNEVPAGTATNITITGLIPGDTYYFVATTVNLAGMESSFSGEVSYQVPVPVPGNQPPTLNAISNMTISENAGLQTVGLSGITSGATNASPTLTVTAISSNTGLIPNPTVNYTSTNTSGSLTFTPVASQSGTATITVTVDDHATSSNLFSRTFTVTVNPVGAGALNPPTLNPIASVVITNGTGSRTIMLTGIGAGTGNSSQKLKVTVSDVDPLHVLYRPVIYYTRPSANGVVIIRPNHGTGTATVTVTVNNGDASNNIVSQHFTVTVVPTARQLAQIASAQTSNHAVSANAAVRGMAAVSTLTPTAHAPGQFALSIGGTVGRQYVVQASTDMVHWVSVATNRVPFTFMDPDAGKFPARFYRSVFLH